jgi:biotin operon repressor
MTLQTIDIGPRGVPRPPGITERQARKIRSQRARAALRTRRKVIWDALNGGRPITADEIGRRAGVTKRAIWREVERLRALGYIIRGATGFGYSGTVKRDTDV